METMIPLLMASIIDDGINKGDMKHVCLVGGLMALAAVVGLYAGIMGGVCGARASAGFAKNLREAMFTNIQTYSFANLDKYSTACAERISDDSSYVLSGACKPDLRHGYGVYDQSENCRHLSVRGIISGIDSGSDHLEGNQAFQ